ncbi:TPA: hypothetical protein JLG68_001353 [Escherichia coli]|nr:hypothetical protein [Escherichia coli]
MKRSVVAATLLTLFSLSAHAMNYDVICEGRLEAHMSIAQGEHAIVLDGKPDVYKYTDKQERYAIYDYTEEENATVKRLEMFFPAQPGNDGVTFSYRRSGEMTIVTPGKGMLHNCKVIDSN